MMVLNMYRFGGITTTVEQHLNPMLSLHSHGFFKELWIMLLFYYLTSQIQSRLDQKH